MSGQRPLHIIHLKNIHNMRTNQLRTNSIHSYKMCNNIHTWNRIEGFSQNEVVYL